MTISPEVHLDVKTDPRATKLNFTVSVAVKGTIEFYDGSKWVTLLSINKSIKAESIGVGAARMKFYENVGHWEGALSISDVTLYVTDEGKTEISDKSKWPKNPKRGDFKVQMSFSKGKAIIDAFSPRDGGAKLKRQKRFEALCETIDKYDSYYLQDAEAGIRERLEREKGRKLNPSDCEEIERMINRSISGNLNPFRG